MVLTTEDAEDAEEDKEYRITIIVCRMTLLQVNKTLLFLCVLCG